MNDDLNIQMLIKLLAMTTSPNDGEALNAVRMANAALARHNANWDEVLRGKVPMVDVDPFAKAPSIGRMRGDPVIKHTDASEIEDYFTILTSRDLGTFKAYVDDVYKWWQEKGFLTEKQYNVIKNAAQRRNR